MDFRYPQTCGCRNVPRSAPITGHHALTCVGLVVAIPCLARRRSTCTLMTSSTILDELGIGQATVAGLSMGGYIVMAMLRRHPERVRGVMLVSTKATPDTEAGKQGRNDMIALVQQDGTTAVADKMLPQVLTERTQNANAELTSFVRAMMVGIDTEGIVGAATAMRDRPDSTPTLAATTVPILIVVGEDDTLTTVKDAQAMQTANPNARIVIVPDAAHLVSLERPDDVNRAFLDFLGGSTEV